MKDQRMKACIALAKLAWSEWPSSSVHKIAATWGDGITDDELAALRWLESQPEFKAARAKVWDEAGGATLDELTPSTHEDTT
jgi:hypothetical protein